MMCKFFCNFFAIFVLFILDLEQCLKQCINMIINMNIGDSSTKNKIINKTFEILVNEEIEKVTIRKIAKDAGVAVSAINYHFGSKENLISIAIKDAIGKMVESYKELYIKSEGNPIDKLKMVLKATCKYIIEHPRIVKISILNDLQRGKGDDNITQSAFVLNYIFKNILYNSNNLPKKTKKEIGIISYQIIASIHFAFFRSEQMKDEIGIDFFKESDMNKYIEIIINNLITNQQGVL
jgi:hypothetical protein